MKSVLNPNDLNEIISRVEKLKPDSQRQWGKMDVAQMIRHCRLADQYYFGEVTIKPHWIRFIFGKMILKNILSKPNAEMKKGSPTAKYLFVNYPVENFEEEKKNWLERLQKYSNFTNDSFEHAFFGKMNRDQIGQLAYKHADHHLKQFGE